MLADCDRCALRDIACADCLITVLPGGQAGLGEAERSALRVLAQAGLVPPLRFAAAQPAATGPGPAAPAAAAGSVPAAPAAAGPAPAGRPRAPGARRPRNVRGPSPASPARHRIEIVKPGPSVGEAVETALALH